MLKVLEDRCREEQLLKEHERARNDLDVPTFARHPRSPFAFARSFSPGARNAAERVTASLDRSSSLKLPLSS